MLYSRQYLESPFRSKTPNVDTVRPDSTRRESTFHPRKEEAQLLQAPALANEEPQHSYSPLVMMYSATLFAPMCVHGMLVLGWLGMLHFPAQAFFTSVFGIPRPVGDAH